MLKLVGGAVAKQDLIPQLTHFCFKNGVVQATDGRIAINAPCPELEKFEFTVPAKKFIQAVTAAGAEPKFNITPGGKVGIKGKNFKALIPIGDVKTYPFVDIVTDNQVGIESIPSIDILKLMKTFVSENTAQPWACGILFNNNFAYATNNKVLIQVECKWDFGAKNIPKTSIDELIKMGSAGLKPFGVSSDDNSMTFHFDDNFWLKTQLLENQWPDMASMFKDASHDVPDGLLEAVQTVVPFCPEQFGSVIHFSENGVATSLGDTSAEQEGFNLPKALYSGEDLINILKIADKFDPDCYPGLTPFMGVGFRGLLVGIRSSGFV